MKRIKKSKSPKDTTTKPPRKSRQVQPRTHSVGGSEVAAYEDTNNSREPATPTQDELGERRRRRDELQENLREGFADFDVLQSLVESPNGPFAAPIAKCWLLFESEWFYDCVVQLNSLLPTIVSHVYMSELASESSEYPGFEKAIVALNSGKLISNRLNDGLAQMWIDSRQFQFVLPSTDFATSALKRMAQGLLDILDRVEQEFADLIGWDGLGAAEEPA